VSDVTQTSSTTTTQKFAPGTPIWVDLGSPDVQASRRFYEQLFGWQSEDMGEEAGHYTMFSQKGKRTAAVGGLMNENQPTAWSTYLATNDAAATAKKVKDAGGQVLVEPFPVMEEGVMAVFMDPTGAAFSVWQPNKMGGADIYNTPVSLTWNELQTRDMDKAKAFYPKVFPYGVKSNDMPGGMQYTEFQIDGKSIAGGMPMAQQIPPSVPPHWLVYFAVDDTDATVKRAQELGGKVMAPAMDIPQGRFAVLTDPQGAAFGVIKNAPR